MSDNIRVLRLTSGEEIVCNATQSHSGTYEVTDCLLLYPGESANSLRFLPWMPYVEHPISINNKHVVFSAKPDTSILENYSKVFGKIVLYNSWHLHPRLIWW